MDGVGVAEAEEAEAEETAVVVEITEGGETVAEEPSIATTAVTSAVRQGIMRMTVRTEEVEAGVGAGVEDPPVAAGHHPGLAAETGGGPTPDHVPGLPAKTDPSAENAPHAGSRDQQQNTTPTNNFFGG